LQFLSTRLVILYQILKGSWQTKIS